MICFLGFHVSFRRKKQSVKWILTSSFGYVPKMVLSEFTDRMEVMPKLTDCPWSWSQWWVEDAIGARRCLANGLMQPNVCVNS